MKAALTLVPLLVLSTPALAAGPVDPPQAAATAAPAAKFTLETPIEALVADPAAKAVIDKDLPGLVSHPQYEMFKSMGLSTLAGFAADRLTPEVLAKVKTELSQIK